MNQQTAGFYFQSTPEDVAMTKAKTSVGVSQTAPNVLNRYREQFNSLSNSFLNRERVFYLGRLPKRGFSRRTQPSTLLQSPLHSSPISAPLFSNLRSTLLQSPLHSSPISAPLFSNLRSTLHLCVCASISDVTPLPVLLPEWFPRDILCLTTCSIHRCFLFHQPRNFLYKNQTSRISHSTRHLPFVSTATFQLPLVSEAFVTTLQIKVFPHFLSKPSANIGFTKYFLGH